MTCKNLTRLTESDTSPQFCRGPGKSKREQNNRALSPIKLYGLYDVSRDSANGV